MTPPIPVRGVDLARAGDALAGLGDAREAHVLVRYEGMPLCRLLMPVTQGRIPIDAIWDAANAAIAREEEGGSEASSGLEFVYPPAPLPNATLPPCAVIVCTKDRPEDLNRCLTALAAAASDGVELLVVDNAPSDDRTRAVVRSFPSVTYVLEPRQGLNWARHDGARAARHEILLYVDDDVVVEPDWVDELRRPFADESVAAATGAVEPLELETEGQILAERFAGFYRGFKPRRFSVNGTSPAGAGAAGAGASMAVRRSIALELKRFESEMDGGTATRSGGDHHAFYVILREGHAIEYTPRALSWHRHRRTAEEVERALYGYGSGSICAALRAWRANRDWDIPLVIIRWRLFPALREAWLAWRSGGQTRPMNLVRAEWRGFLEAFSNDREAARREASHPPGPEPTPGPPLAPAALPLVTRSIGSEPATPAISVVIPTHNRRDALERTLHALAMQTLDLGEFEVIVVANGCVDTTRDYVAGLHPAHALRLVEQNHDQLGLSGASLLEQVEARTAAVTLLYAYVLVQGMIGHWSIHLWLSSSPL
jgi:glycosyltransferase involved in cell wall biosynthesis